MSPTIVLESMPPLRNAPSGTSETQPSPHGRLQQPANLAAGVLQRALDVGCAVEPATGGAQ